jgi:hypothetical protein
MPNFGAKRLNYAERVAVGMKWENELRRGSGRGGVLLLINIIGFVVYIGPKFCNYKILILIYLRVLFCNYSC